MFALVFTVACSTITKEKENDIFITEKPADPLVVPPPGDFVVTVSKVTDNTITLDWTTSPQAPNQILTYGIATNDSVIISEIKQRTYTFKNLIPDKDYSFKVVAFSSNFEKKAVLVSAHTLKSFIEKVVTFNYALRRFNFQEVVKTADNGYLVYGDITEWGFQNKLFMMKLSADFSVIWKSEFIGPTGGFGEVQMVECSDHNILFVTNNTVYKYDPQANTIWAYQKTSNVNFFECISENSDGSFYLIGDAPNALYPKGNQYVVVKLDANGIELFQKTITAEGPVRIKKIMIDGNNLVLLGTISDAQLFISKLDFSGNLIISQKFLTKYSAYCSESPYAMVLTKDNNYLVMSNLNGPIFSSSYTNLPRYFKVNKGGTIIWDQFQNITSGGYDSWIHGIDVLDNGKYLTILSDDNGTSLVLLNELGNVEKHYKLTDFQTGMFVDMNAQGKYLYFTINMDKIILFDPAGYWE